MRVMMEVKPTHSPTHCQSGPMTIGSGRNGLDLGKFYVHFCANEKD